MSVGTGCGLPYGYVELAKVSGREKYDVFTTTANGATRVFYGPWADRQNFIHALLPGVAEANGEIVFTDPGVYPDLPNLMAVSADVEGSCKVSATGNDGQIAYDFAKITVEYAYVTGNTNGPGLPTPGFPNFLTISGNISSEVLTFEKEELLDSALGPILKAVHKVVPVTEITIIELFNIAPKWRTYHTIAGKVNNIRFNFPKIDNYAEPDELLYRGVTFTEKGFLNSQLGPRQVWQLEHSFSFKHEPNWNQAYNRKGELKDANKLNADPLYSRIYMQALFNAA